VRGPDPVLRREVFSIRTPSALHAPTYWRNAPLVEVLRSNTRTSLSYCVAAGLCTEAQDEEVAAEQLAQSIRALEAQVLKAEGELAAVRAQECARLDAELNPLANCRFINNMSSTWRFPPGRK
jgi:hypothetical protein